MSSVEEEKRSTGKRCVAYGCSTSSASQHSDGLSLHLFPRGKPTLCKQWTQFVRRKRVWDGPTRYSALCERHFETNAYPLKYSILGSMNIAAPKKKRLNDDAVPTIHVDPIGNDQEIEKESTKLAEVEGKNRSAYMKRENIRVIKNYEDEIVSTVPPVENEMVQMEQTFSQEPQSLSKSIGTQLSLKRPSFRSVRVQVVPHATNKGCQANMKPKMKSVGVQCNIMQRDVQINDVNRLDNIKKLEDESDPFSEPSDTSDESFRPDSETSTDVTSDDENRLPTDDRLFVVSEACLMDLFTVCPICSAASLGSVSQLIGTMVKIDQDCGVCGYHRQWCSQPLISNIPVGNLRLSCSILFSGALPSKSLRLFNFMKIPVICNQTFMNHQKTYLHPAVNQVWYDHQKSYFNDLQNNGREICIGGDGRCDTPGHSAKYGSYSVMDLDRKTMIDVQLIQSNEVASSSHMEKEGLLCSIALLNAHNVKVHTIITDRHVQIRKWVRENMVGTKHCIDVWHVAKGLKKKLLALSKEKDCDELTDWIKSITNHLYWVAASTPNAAKEVMLEKWISLGNHIQNIHEGHGDHFPQCLHLELDDRERKKRWLKPGTKSLEKLLPLLETRQMKMDIPMLSTNQQTSDIEGYHSVINHFAPKMYGFSYNGMKCRLLMAALHYNENGGRDSATTKDGDSCINVVYPKFKKGGFTVREVKVEATYDYVEELFLASENQLKMKNTVVLTSPPPLCHNYIKPTKENAVSMLTSRFRH